MNYFAWLPAICEARFDERLVSKLQRALKEAGSDPGEVDSVLGASTWGAVESFQSGLGLARGAVTIETLEALGLD